ncbi:bifunctional oligoribonuclease/PAP phosphatase NrnA [soil metagenome]
MVLTTHLNADGDGAGSEAAVAAWLKERGIAPTIVNPTAFPRAFRFLIPDPSWVADPDSVAGRVALADADLFVVLDAAEPQRLAALAGRFPPERTLVIDHHPAGGEAAGEVTIQDPTAAATGELIWDLIQLSGDPLSDASALGIYVALVSDTGSFRYANTTPRVHAIASRLLAQGVNAEEVYRQLYATVPRRRLELLREALATLQVDAELPLAWMSVPREVARRTGATSDDYEGLVEHIRSLEGIEVGILFRETYEGSTKLSLRSNGAANVNRIARRFEGGGHEKASGALVRARLDDVVPEVLEAARAELRGTS